MFVLAISAWAGLMDASETKLKINNIYRMRWDECSVRFKTGMGLFILALRDELLAEQLGVSLFLSPGVFLLGLIPFDGGPCGAHLSLILG